MQNGGIKIINTINFLICIVLFAIIAYVVYQHVYDYEKIQSVKNHFELTVPKKYAFETNTNAVGEALSLAVWDSETSTYIFAYAYGKDGKLKEYVEEEIESVREDNEQFRDVSELSEKIINDNIVYMYSYNYTDEYDDDYYAKILWIDGQKGDYFLVLECLEAEKDTHIENLDKIANSFVEL